MLTLLADENMPMVDELFADFCWIERKAGRAITNTDLQDVDILLVRSITQVNQALLQKTPVKFVGTATIGTDHIDLDYLQQSEIEFSDAAGCNAQAVAEYVLAAIAYWSNNKRLDLSQVTVGIIGAGNVGTKLSRLLDHIGIDYLLNDPLLESTDDERDFVSLDTVSQCQIVTCHVPLSKAGEHPTYHLIDKSFLAKMQDDSLLINSSRGAVLDNLAALETARSEKSVEFVLDVWEQEPRLNPQLLEKCLIGTSHIAGYSLEGKIRGTYYLYQATRNWLAKDSSVSLESLLPNTLLWQKPNHLADLHDSLKPFYDIKEDDLALRNISRFDSERIAKEFDLLRKNYKNRLEYYR
ncbi:4-phosphoerythronate dehydrogenase [Kangiella sp. HZ709]|uniref:4-phosphoerythronate dehydrogenase n=1 Tax=Kangiella sp. HZ709 TaxID=2666328 RepID=UPI001D0DADCF|nr:4-phosphoerythronate dehydrogenase [Kangiella sp. HZ709]